MKIKNRVYITCTSSISCAGNNNRILFENLLTQTTGIRQDLNYFANTSPAIGRLKMNHSFYEELVNQCQQILNSSKLKDFKDTLLIIGSSVGGMNITEEIYIKTQNYADINPNMHHIQSISDHLRKSFYFCDSISFSTACTSSANAMGYAHEVLSKGLYKKVLVVGADTLSKTTVGGFLTLGVLSSYPCKPFDVERNGMNVSEAIACLLLEVEKQEGCVELCGVGYSSDAYHMTHPHPEGHGAISSMTKALKQANLHVNEIDYINAHGTGTQANDSAEGNAIVSLFPDKPYVGSSKSVTGHTLGASGALEAIISCMVIKEQMIPPNLFLENIENPSLNLVLEVQKTAIEYVMSNSFAFGGNNCSLIFGKVSHVS